MARKKIEQRNFQQKLKVILDAENAAYEEAGITRHFAVAFPNRHKPPLLGRLGVKLLTIAGGVIQLQFSEKRDK